MMNKTGLARLEKYDKTMVFIRLSHKTDRIE